MDKPLVFQEVEAHTFQDSLHMKVVILSALESAVFAHHFWYSFLLEAESKLGPYCCL